MLNYPYEAKEERNSAKDNWWWYHFNKGRTKWAILCDVPECNMCEPYKEQW